MIQTTYCRKTPKTRAKDALYRAERLIDSARNYIPLCWDKPEKQARDGIRNRAKVKRAARLIAFADALMGDA